MFWLLLFLSVNRTHQNNQKCFIEGLQKSDFSVEDGGGRDPYPSFYDLTFENAIKSHNHGKVSKIFHISAKNQAKKLFARAG